MKIGTTANHYVFKKLAKLLTPWKAPIRKVCIKCRKGTQERSTKLCKACS